VNILAGMLCVSGDGNCLLHAVSMFMWGYPDDNMFLRKVLHSNMSQCSCKTELRQRWQKQREWQNTFIPDGGLQYSDEVSAAVFIVSSLSSLCQICLLVDFFCCCLQS